MEFSCNLLKYCTQGLDPDFEYLCKHLMITFLTQQKSWLRSDLFMYAVVDQIECGLVSPPYLKIL